MNELQRLLGGLDKHLHEPRRLSIVSVLAAVESMSFTELKLTLELTDGNLSVHLQKLEEAGYVEIDKQFVGKRPRTTCSLTATGRQAFKAHLDQLEAIVKQGRLPQRA